MSAFEVIGDIGDLRRLHGLLLGRIRDRHAAKRHNGRRIASLQRLYTVFWHAREGVSFALNEDTASHRHHPFWVGIGLQDPAAVSKGKLGGFPTQLNFGETGPTKFAGAYLRAEDGSIHLAHSGRLKGLKVADVLKAYPGPVLEDVKAADGTRRRYILIGRLDDARLFASVCAFARFVQDFKQGRGHPSLSKLTGPEFSGRTTVGARAAYEADYQHGRVVQALQERLEAARKRCWRTQSEDLLAGGSAKAPTLLFEVKTEASPQHIYTAIGQLQFHGAGYQRPPIRTIVLPQTLATRSRRVLEQLGLRVVTFAESTRGIDFQGLDRLMS